MLAASSVPQRVCSTCSAMSKTRVLSRFSCNFLNNVVFTISHNNVDCATILTTLTRVDDSARTSNFRESHHGRLPVYSQTQQGQSDSREIIRTTQTLGRLNMSDYDSRETHYGRLSGDSLRATLSLTQFTHHVCGGRELVGEDRLHRHPLDGAVDVVRQTAVVIREEVPRQRVVSQLHMQTVVDTATRG